jgi:tripartite-type tricarboxylate transporter receptor subunit TctC
VSIDAARRAALAGLALVAAGLAGRPARASDTRPLRLIVPQAPGGAADNLGRLLSQGLAHALGRKVIVDNRPGGGSIVGTQAVALAPPDGGTIGLVFSALAINQALRPHMPYDAFADFDPICLGGYTVMALVAHPALPADDVAQLIALARRTQPALQYASLGIGSASHIAGELFNAEVGVTLEHVPYNGSAQIYREMQGGRLQLAFVTLESALPLVQAGRLKVLAITNARRAPRYPRIPAIAETVPGFEMLGFFGFVAPAGTSRPWVEEVRRAIEKTLTDPQAQARLAPAGVEVTVSTPAAFADFLRGEVQKYAALARRTGVRLEGG